MSAVGQVQAEVATKLEDSTTHIIKTWKSSDGSSWYRKWSDGFIEQGGHQSKSIAGYVTINLPTPFTTNLYSIGAVSSLGEGIPRVTERNTNKFIASSAGASCSFLWIACGY